MTAERQPTSAPAGAAAFVAPVNKLARWLVCRGPCHRRHRHGADASGADEKAWLSRHDGQTRAAHAAAARSASVLSHRANALPTATVSQAHYNPHALVVPHTDTAASMTNAQWQGTHIASRTLLLRTQ